MQGRPKQQKIDKKKLEAQRKETERLYKNTNLVHCPYIKEDVHFNTHGLRHLKFKSWGRPRKSFDEYVRLKLFYLAPRILKKSRTVQGIWDTRDWVERKKHGKKEKVLKEVKYLEFVAVVGKARMKVIVKRIEGGSYFFYSLIPFWGMNSMTGKRKLYYSDLERETGSNTQN